MLLLLLAAAVQAALQVAFVTAGVGQSSSCECGVCLLVAAFLAMCVCLCKVDVQGCRIELTRYNCSGLCVQYVA
jgi:hypothetical protein